MIDPIDPPPLPDRPSSESDPYPSPNRDAIADDLAVFLTKLMTSGRWTLLDRAVTLLTGQSLTRRSSAVSWAITHLPDDELELVLVGFLERTAGYLGLAPPAPPPGEDELRVIGHVLELARRAP